MNRFNQVTYLTQVTIWESDKITRKHRKQESKEVSPFPAYKEQTIQHSKGKRKTWNTAKKMIHKK